MIGERIGCKQITTAIQKLLTVSDLVDLEKIKESKSYKGYRHLAEDGELLTISSFEEYCMHIEDRSGISAGHLFQFGQKIYEGHMDYGTTHQFGRPEDNIPARPFLGISEDDKNEILSIINRHLTRALE